MAYPPPITMNLPMFLFLQDIVSFHMAIDKPSPQDIQPACVHEF